VYVAQIEAARLESVISDRKYLEATREVLMKHGGLWFWDESYHYSCFFLLRWARRASA
jgi:hypothetical protein